ncbi:hypothetical protein [Lichenicoccus sp.]|uniref:hypothetical protein n=1 Tax=Lichenicoccus sp. TaxID=2781899 RepID=UPI003D130FAC
MLTVKLAKALLADGIKVNAADPGYTAAVELAILGPLGPTGGFSNDGYADKMGHYRW